ETRTIHVDDHGAPARQTVTVFGETTYAEGETLTLTTAVDPTTVLTDYRWERKAAGQEEFTVVKDETAAELSIEAALADDGAQYRAAPVTPAGTLGYGPSEPVEVTVTEALDDPGSDDPGSDDPGSGDPGSGDPGSDEPGSDEPGSDQPGSDQPDSDEPGSDDPGTGDPAPDDPAAGAPGADEPSRPSGGVLPATGASGLATLIGVALALTLGGGLLIALRRVRRSA